MQLTQLLIDELDREIKKTRRVLEQVPAGRDDWKPHPKSMPLARLAGLVASMPSWVSMIIEQESLDLKPPSGGGQYQQPAIDQLAATLDKSAAKGREALSKTNDEYLMTTNWKLLVAGNVVLEQPRHIFLRDTLNHLAHHRGQLTVYLRLNDRQVPAVYGPTADDQGFG